MGAAGRGRRACPAGGAGFTRLRHYYASLLIQHGESVKVVQAGLGHAKGAETVDTYRHLWPDSGDQTRTATDSVLELLRTPCGPTGLWTPRIEGQRR